MWTIYFFVGCFFLYTDWAYGVSPASRRVNRDQVYASFPADEKARKTSENIESEFKPFPCTSKISHDDMVMYKFPSFKNSEIIGVSQVGVTPYLLTASWNSENGEFIIDCQGDQSSFLCTKLLTNPTCIKSPDEFCVKLREADTGVKSWLTITIQTKQTLMPFDKYKSVFKTTQCPKPGYHKAAILEFVTPHNPGVCGPFDQYKFKVEKTDGCNAQGGNMWYLHRQDYDDSSAATKSEFDQESSKAKTVAELERVEAAEQQVGGEKIDAMRRRRSLLGDGTNSPSSKATKVWQDC
mgnify:CR=1 FL=1|jgi:hypothetical protein